MSVVDQPQADQETSPSTDYHSRPEKSSTEIAIYLDDPIRWYHEYYLKDWKREVTPAMEFGTSVHTMLEIGSYESLALDIPPYVLNADGHCKGKLWTIWKEENPAQVYIKPGEVNALKLIWENITANSWIANHMRQGQKEVEHFWFDEDLSSECRMKADLINVPILIDWKTTSKPDARTFAADAFSRSYDVRLAFYRRGFRNKYGCDPEVYVVAIRTTGGMQVSPYRMPDAWLDDAEARLMFIVDEMKNFSLEAYLDSKPVDLIQPRYATFDLESA
jgi:hypothetical protein